MASSAAPLATEKWFDSSTVAVVTGANKGIGYDIARLLCEQGITTVVTARNAELGRRAIDTLSRSPASVGKLDFHQLDVSDKASVDMFAEWLRQNHGGLNILVNNAGIAFKGSSFSAGEAQATLDTNLYGTANMCEAMKPLMREGARIVNVSSMAGKTSIIRDPKLRQEFVGASSKEEVFALARRFVTGIQSNNHQAGGWPNTMYGVSKLCESTYTRVLADELKSKGVLVAACCPGYCATDMSSWGGSKTAAEGADTPVWLALTAPRDCAATTGRYWTGRQNLPW
ncbi:MAG: hypothetical protein WDW38_000668 [Sanguina aurantia]